jgi:hypothetical protein
MFAFGNTATELNAATAEKECQVFIPRLYPDTKAHLKAKKIRYKFSFLQWTSAETFANGEGGFG